ncbi:MAG: hypothetical protein WDZ94_02750 [Patescibacteria group bacterium]
MNHPESGLNAEQHQSSSRLDQLTHSDQVLPIREQLDAILSELRQDGVSDTLARPMIKEIYRLVLEMQIVLLESLATESETGEKSKKLEFPMHVIPTDEQLLKSEAVVRWFKQHGFTTKESKAFYRLGLTPFQMVSMNDKELLRYRNIGPTTVKKWNELKAIIVEKLSEAVEKPGSEEGDAPAIVSTPVDDSISPYSYPDRSSPIDANQEE